MLNRPLGIFRDVIICELALLDWLFISSEIHTTCNLAFILL